MSYRTILNLAADATDDVVLAAVKELRSGADSVCAEAGVANLSAVVGVIKSGKEAITKYEKAASDLAKLEAESADREKTGIITSLEASGKLTPAMRDWAKSVDLLALKAFASVAPVIVHRGVEAVEPKSSTVASYNGKPFSELSIMERQALANENLSLYQSLRDAAAIAH